MNTSIMDREGFAAFLLRMRAAGMDDKLLMTAFEAVPRRNFIRSEFQDASWSRGAVPIDCGETLEGVDQQCKIISALGIDAENRILEVGTGSGFTTAVMSKLAKRVYTIERSKTLQQVAESRFKALKIDNVISRAGNGSKGTTDGPFDRIVLWAAFDAVPRHFIEFLVSGGVMVCAVGNADEEQTLVRLTKVGSRYEREDIGIVRMQMLRL